MEGPRKGTSSFKERHPRLTGGLYQVAICVLTFYCAVAIARYGPRPGPAIDDPTGTGNATNATVEWMCKWGAREEDVDLKPLEVFLLFTDV